MSLRPQPQPPLAGDERDRPANGARSRRRELRRRRATRRLDILIGLVAGGIWLLVAPGIAMAAIVAAFVLLVAGASLVAVRVRARRRRRRRRPAGSRRTPS